MVKSPMTEQELQRREFLVKRVFRHHWRHRDRADSMLFIVLCIDTLRKYQKMRDKS